MTTQTISALYDHYSDAEAAVRDIKAAGVPEANISVIAHKNAYPASSDLREAHHEASGAGTGAVIGTVLGGGAGLLAGIGAIAIPGIGPVVAAGWLVAAIAGGAVGAAGGGLLGSLADIGSTHEEREVYAEGVRRGGILVAVRYDDVAHGDVRAILDSYHPVDVETRRASYRDTGWTGYDPASEPYSETELVRERERLRAYDPRIDRAAE